MVNLGYNGLVIVYLHRYIWNGNTKLSVDYAEGANDK
jgi:hypothetical protein